MPQRHETLAVVHPDLAEGAAHVARLVHVIELEVQAKEPRLEETLDGVAPFRVGRESIEGAPRARGGRGGGRGRFCSLSSERIGGARRVLAHPTRPGLRSSVVLGGLDVGTPRGDPPRGRCWPRGARARASPSQPRGRLPRPRPRDRVREDRPHRHTRLRPRARDVCRGFGRVQIFVRERFSLRSGSRRGDGLRS